VDTHFFYQYAHEFLVIFMLWWRTNSCIIHRVQGEKGKVNTRLHAGSNHWRLNNCGTKWKRYSKTTFNMGAKRPHRYVRKYRLHALGWKTALKMAWHV
jgi:hypothetical protein